VGVIALAGLDAETGIVMLLYLDLSYNRWHQEGRISTLKDIEDSVMEGAVKRIRPKIMTVSVILAGLVPIMFSTGTGADVMKRIAAPMVGGVVTSTILELIIYPAIYVIWKECVEKGREEFGVMSSKSGRQEASRNENKGKAAGSAAFYFFIFIAKTCDLEL
jgi:Cu/Ag efflux pump CusA